MNQKPEVKEEGGRGETKNELEEGRKRGKGGEERGKQRKGRCKE